MMMSHFLHAYTIVLAHNNGMGRHEDTIPTPDWSFWMMWEGIQLRVGPGALQGKGLLRDE